MMASTHVTFGLSLWVGYTQIQDIPLEPIPLLLVGLGALLPDIDHPNSTFGKAVPFVAYPISAIFGHRGITHSFLAVAGGAALLWTNQYSTYFITPLIVGYISHVLGDFLTGKGVPLLWPSKEHYALPLFTTGSILEWLFNIALMSFLGWMLWQNVSA